MDCRFVKTLYQLEWLLSIKWYEEIELFSKPGRSCEESGQLSFTLLYSNPPGGTEASHKRSQSGWLAIQLIFKDGA
jgi:hypothetical protein